jgi:hypothetical protein
VVAAHGEIQPLGEGIDAAFNLADTAPVEIGGIIVLFVAGDLAAVAADALRHVEVEAVLLAGAGSLTGDQPDFGLFGGTNPRFRRETEEWIVFANPILEW